MELFCFVYFTDAWVVKTNGTDLLKPPQTIDSAEKANIISKLFEIGSEAQIDSTQQHEFTY